MAAWSPKTLKTILRIAFFGDTTHYGKIFKFCFECFHRDIDRRIVLKFRPIWLTGNLRNCALLTWQKTNFVWLDRPSCRYCYCTDGAQNLPGPAPQSAPDFTLIGSFSAQLYSRKREYQNAKKRRKVNPIFGRSQASIRINNQSDCCRWWDTSRCHEYADGTDKQDIALYVCMYNVWQTDGLPDRSHTLFTSATSVY